MTKKMMMMVCAAAVTAAAAAQANQEPFRVATFETYVPLEAKAVKDAPYSAEIVIDRTQTLADGNRIVEHSTGRVFRDRDGRVRREDDRHESSPTISIVDPVAGTSYFLDPEKHIAWRTPTPSGLVTEKLQALEALRRQGNMAGQFRVERMGGAAGTEAGGVRFEVRRMNGEREQRTDEQLPGRMIEGVQADGHRVTTTIPAGAIGNELPIVVTSEEWKSPQLQVLVLTERKDPRFGDTSYRLLNVTRTDPDASLFQVPADYTIKDSAVRLQRNER